LRKSGFFVHDASAFFPDFAERATAPFDNLAKASAEGELHSAGEPDFAGSFAETSLATSEAMTRIVGPILVRIDKRALVVGGWSGVELFQVLLR